jgi:PAS domain S-box-containing protein
MIIDQSLEILRLRATVRDLLALSIIPEAWVGREPPAIAADLADLLIGSLKLDFAFVRLCNPTEGQAVDVIRGDCWKGFPEWLQQRFVRVGPVSRTEIVTNVGGVEKSCCGVVIPIGVNSERGLIAAACDRSDFPDQIDQQLLSVAANNAATAFQNARLINELRSAQEALRDQEQELRKARDELEIKVAERTSELRNSERELRDVIDAIPTIAWSALPDGSNTYVNKGFAEYSGLSVEQAAGSGWQAATHLDDLQQHLSKWMASVATGEPFENELRFRRADGQYRWHLCRGVPLRDNEERIVKWYGILFDINELKKTESALQEREHELLGIIDTIPSLLWSASPTGEPTHLSKRVLEYSGLHFEDFIDLGWKRFVHPDDYEETARVFFKAIQTGESYNLFHRLRRADGEYRWHHARGEPLRGLHDEIVQWYGLAVDIDDWKRAEDHLRDMRTKLTRASQIATVAELSASIAHELNQPLMSVLANAQAGKRWLAANPPNLLETSASIERIIRDARAADQVIQHIRGLFRQESFEKKEVSIRDVFSEAVRFLHGDPRKHDISIDWQLNEHLPTVSVDLTQIQQVFINLISNAMEALEVSQISPHIIVRASTADQNQMLIQVIDNGPGVADQERIFDAFVTTKNNGMGIGLAVSRSIVEAHGGRLWAENNPSGGATFSVALPLSSGQSNSSSSYSGQTDSNSRGRASGKVRRQLSELEDGP